MKQYIDKSAVVAEIERRLEKIANAQSENNRELSAIYGAQQYELINLVQYIDTLEVKEEPTSKDLEEAAHYYVDTTIEWFDSKGNPCCFPAFIAGAQWQKEQMIDKGWEYINNQLNLPSDFEQHFRKAMEE